MDKSAIIASALGAVSVSFMAAFLLRLLFARARAELDMPEEDKAIWRTAASLADVAALTAQWLTGDLRGQPGYCGPVDVDEEDAPGMTAALIACNRAGFLTTSSQAGHDGPGYDGTQWQLLAAVDGLISHDDLPLLHSAFAGTGVVVDDSGRGQVVTSRAGRPITQFGARFAEWDDDWTGHGICTASAVAELQQACPVVILDPEPGRNDRLWPALAHLAKRLQAGSATSPALKASRSGGTPAGPAQ